MNTIQGLRQISITVMKLGGGEFRAVTDRLPNIWLDGIPKELRFNPYHDSKGQFTSASGAGKAGKSKSALTKAKSRGKMKSLKIGKREYTRLCHEIATNYPTLKVDGIARTHYSRNYMYRFKTIEFGTYNFIKKTPLK